jgi:histidinol-phosphate aminotransferase
MLKSLSWLKPYPSFSNFILCSLTQEKLNNTVDNSNDELTAKKIWMKLREKGIYIRYFDTKILNNFIRISVGKPEDSDVLLSALREVYDGR